MVNFRPIDRSTPYLLPPSVEDWLPKDLSSAKIESNRFDRG